MIEQDNNNPTSDIPLTWFKVEYFTLVVTYVPSPLSFTTFDWKNLVSLSGLPIHFDAIECTNASSIDEVF